MVISPRGSFLSSPNAGSVIALPRKAFAGDTLVLIKPIDRYKRDDG
jgi:hypothetical protein